MHYHSNSSINLQLHVKYRFVIFYFQFFFAFFLVGVRVVYFWQKKTRYFFTCLLSPLFLCSRYNFWLILAVFENFRGSKFLIRAPQSNQGKTANFSIPPRLSFFLSWHISLPIQLESAENGLISAWFASCICKLHKLIAR